MKNTTVKIASISIALVLLLTSCGRQISPDVYSGDSIGEVCETFSGTICNVRIVRIEEFERPDEYGLGAVAGGVAGGIAGSSIGEGTGKTAAIATGAVAGLIGGSLLEKRMRSQDAIEYVVKLDNGNLLTVVQGVRPSLPKGQKVYVMIGYEGRSRVIPQT